MSERLKSNLREVRVLTTNLPIEIFYFLNKIDVALFHFFDKIGEIGLNIFPLIQ